MIGRTFPVQPKISQLAEGQNGREHEDTDSQEAEPRYGGTGTCKFLSSRSIRAHYKGLVVIRSITFLLEARRTSAGAISHCRLQGMRDKAA